MKGFYFASVVFVAVFLIVVSAAFLFSTSQRGSSNVMVREAETARVINDVEGDMLRFTTTAYETLASNSLENNRTKMQEKIASVISQKWNASVKVSLLNASNVNTRVSLYFYNYSLNGAGGFVNLTGANFSTVVGHAFFHFSYIFDSFNASDLCAYADFDPASVNYCSINYAGFASAKQTQTGFAWLVNITSGDCEAKVINFNVTLLDPNDISTLVNPFYLRPRIGGFEHQAVC